MTRDDLVKFAERDWAAAATRKRDYWMEQYRQHGGALRELPPPRSCFTCGPCSRVIRRPGIGTRIWPITGRSANDWIADLGTAFASVDVEWFLTPAFEQALARAQPGGR